MLIVQRPGQRVNRGMLFAYGFALAALASPMGLLLLLTAHVPMHIRSRSKAQQEAPTQSALVARDDREGS
jgi:hypothetical protein